MSLGTLISSFAVDVVGVFTQDFRQVFTHARPMKAMVKEPSKLMEHPLETGEVTADHSIILQVEIELSMILTPAFFRDTFNEIKQLRNNRTLLTVQTRTGLYTNQLIQDMPHDEDAAIYDTVALALKLKEVQIVTAQYGIVPRNPVNKPVVNRGEQQPEVKERSAAHEKIFGKK